jgi:hypothetical protein
VIGTNHEEGLAGFLEELVESHVVAPMGAADAKQEESRGADAAA